MPGPSDPATRRWRLQGFDSNTQAAKPIHTSTATGDRGLDEAMKRLEADPKITRIRAEQA